MYGLKMAVGRGLTKALSEGVVNREEIFVTSMLWGSDHHDPLLCFGEVITMTLLVDLGRPSSNLVSILLHLVL